MAIYNVEELHSGKRFIDLAGPDGNAFVLLGVAFKLGEQLKDRLMHLHGVTPQEVLEEMQESDYDHLVTTFDRYFGDYVDLYR